MSEPIFVDLSESKATEIESLCMRCQENVSIFMFCISFVFKKEA